LTTDPSQPPRRDAAAEAITDPAHSVALVHGGTFRERMLETLWDLLGQPLMRITFHNWYGLRRWMLGLFGAQIDPTARIRPSVRISYPWRLKVGAHTAVGDHAILFCLGPITIGRRCTISQYAHLCSGSHDYTSRSMTLVTKPIVIEDDVWIAADVFVGPGVTVGRDAVVGARSTVFHPLPPGMICGGDNARPLRPREIRWPPPKTAGAAPA
jgi:putative colanic acid biosynthesis acetyltransferase WcaF